VGLRVYDTVNVKINAVTLSRDGYRKDLSPGVWISWEDDDEPSSASTASQSVSMKGRGAAQLGIEE